MKCNKIYTWIKNILLITNAYKTNYSHKYKHTRKLKYTFVLSTILKLKAFLVMIHTQKNSVLGHQTSKNFKVTFWINLLVKVGEPSPQIFFFRILTCLYMLQHVSIKHQRLDTSQEPNLHLQLPEDIWFDFGYSLECVSNHKVFTPMA